MVPFAVEHCPRCAARTRQWFVGAGPGGAVTAVCQGCRAAVTRRADGAVECRDATAEERWAVPEPVVLSEERRAEWQESLRQSRADLRARLAAGCPGLTPEIERALAPGTIDRLRQFVETPEAGDRPAGRAGGPVSNLGT
jgi:hypothetical protein